MKVEEILVQLASTLANLFKRDESNVHPNEIRMRVASLVYCQDIGVGMTPPNVRAGILADVGLKALIEAYGGETLLRPDVAEKELGTIGYSTKVYVFGRPDAGFKLNNTIFPIELKNSSSHQTIEKGRIQASIYAWLYDAPYGFVIYSHDLRIDVVEPVHPDLLIPRVKAFLRSLANDESPKCPPVNVKVVYKGFMWTSDGRPSKALKQLFEHEFEKENVKIVDEPINS